LRVDEFLVERWMNKYEHNVEVNLAETCVEPFTLKEFLEFTGREDFFEEFKNTQLTYGWIEGSPELRTGISKLYNDVDPDNVLITGGAIEANFNAFYSLVEPGDTVITIFPAYQQLYSVAKGFGANVKRLHLLPENLWLPDIEELKTCIDSKTKMIVLNNPHNPTGSLIDIKMLKTICDLAEEVDAYVMCDEAYRGLYINVGDFVPSIVDIYEKGIATGSFSKPLSLTGLRLGWITSNNEIISECKFHRDYTTISKGMIDDSLGVIAIDNIDRILERSLRIVRSNHKYIDRWINNEPLIDWVAPRAGSVAFMRYSLDISSTEFCKKLIAEKNTFMVPSDCFEIEKHLRIGYGNRLEVLEEGLSRVKEFLDEYR
jgi:aspartate/methionine/tyrosine aminotransferase